MAKTKWQGYNNSLWTRQSQVTGLHNHGTHGRYWALWPEYLRFSCLGTLIRWWYFTVYCIARYAKKIFVGIKQSPGIQKWHLFPPGQVPSPSLCLTDDKQKTCPLGSTIFILWIVLFFILPNRWQKCHCTCYSPLPSIKEGIHSCYTPPMWNNCSLLFLSE